MLVRLPRTLTKNLIGRLMHPFIDQINRTITLSAEAEADVVANLRERTYKKGAVINRDGEVCRQFYFISSGLVKHYYHHNGRRFVIRFFSEGNFFTVLDSFINQTPADFTTVALEDTAVYYLDYEQVLRIAQKHHSFETFLRTLYASAALHNLTRIKEMFNNDAAELYQNFVANNHHLMQRISLGDVAGYLGISQVSLSRVRSAR